MDTIGAICYMITQKQQTLQILLKDLEEYEYGNLNLHIRTGSSDIVVCNDNFKEPYWKHLVPGDYWLDLGGYVGSSALVFLGAGAKRVFSVDADPVHVMLYKNNLELNGYDPDILCAAVVGRRTRSIQDFSINVRSSSKLNVAANTLYADKRWKTARPTIPVPGTKCFQYGSLKLSSQTTISEDPVLICKFKFPYSYSSRSFNRICNVRCFCVVI